MSHPRTVSTGKAVLLLAALSAWSQAGCAGTLASKPTMYTARQERMAAARLDVNMTLVTPVAPKPPTILVLFASGDGGLMGISKAILQHMADQGYYVAAFSSRDALGELRGSDGKIKYAEAVASVSAIVAKAKQALKLPESTPLVVTGMSRGASLVVAVAADPEFRAGMAGGVAMALTRELDYLDVPEGAGKSHDLQLDEQRRVQVYPAIKRAGSTRLAIIQSTNDSYVPSAESRRLLGPDTDTRRLYEVKASNHSFGGGEDELKRDLDEALQWLSAGGRRP